MARGTAVKAQVGTFAGSQYCPALPLQYRNGIASGHFKFPDLQTNRLKYRRKFHGDSGISIAFNYPRKQLP